MLKIDYIIYTKMTIGIIYTIWYYSRITPISNQ